MEKKVEILAPAGSFESMKAAVAAGADAVYIGGSRFGARAFADNLDEERMLEAIDYVHLHGCKIYMTVNTLVKEQELNELFHYLEPYYTRGLDAVIVQDLGVFSYIKTYFPDLPIHASTQMTITGPEGAALIMGLGASRIVTARELSLEEIKEIHEKTGAEIESFVHGALCYCYSGQCLFSSLLGGRSGNRGRCAQTCRLPFDVAKDGKVLNPKDERYPLSLKDLNTLDILPDLIEAGVYSLKIEGRMKSPRYTAGVVQIYRKYIDQYLANGRNGYKVEAIDRKILLELFDRGGQTEGYYRQHNGREMAVLKEKPAFRRENRELYSYLDRTYVEAELKEPVSGNIVVKEGKAAELSLTCGEVQVSVSGQEAQAAKNQPMTEEKIRKQIEKTGNTPFYFEALSVQLEGNPFIPVQELNELRRNGFSALEEAVLKPYRRSIEIIGGRKAAVFLHDKTGEQLRGQESGWYQLHTSIERPESFEAVVKEPGVSEISLDCAEFDPGNWKKWVRQCHEAGKLCFLTLPHIYRKEADIFFKQKKELFLQAGFDGVVIRAWEEIGLMGKWAPELLLILDHNLYTMNHAAQNAIAQMAGGQALRFTLPVELNSRELEAIGCEEKELIVYGRLPVMVTAQCVKKTMERCNRQPEYFILKDRMKMEFPVRNHCRFCYNTIYNSTPLSLLQDKRIIDRLKPGRLRLNFTVEAPDEIRTVVQAFSDSFQKKREASLSGTFTRGHFKRGIE